MRVGRLACVLALVSLGASPALARDRKKEKDKKRDATAAPAPAPEPVPAPAPTPAPAPPPTEEPLWAKGVSAENKATAQQLLSEGNDKFVVNQFRDALEKYKAAVAAWDHPRIRFNMVRTLIALEEPLAALESLHKALQYGKAPLEDEMFTEAQNYQRLLEGQIATLSIQCKQAQVDVKIDGKKFVDCPGAESQRMLPGNHVLVASKPGFKTETKDLVLIPGKTEPIVVELITIEKATVYKTRWATWKPWAVAGGGLVIAGLGALVNVQANKDMDRVTERLSDECSGKGCEADVYESSIKPDEDRALLENKIGIGMIIGGGVVVAAGVVGVIMNRPKPYLKETPPTTKAELVPITTGDGGGFAVVGTF